MHLIWDASRYNSKGQLWLASVEASVSAALLEAHGVTHVWPAGYQRAQTHDPKFYYLPTQDGTGVLAGDIPMAQVVENLVSVARGVLKGYSYVLCCRNGAHRSAMLLALLLMLMSGRTAEQVYHYMHRLRSLVDLRSLPGQQQRGLATARSREGHASAALCPGGACRNRALEGRRSLAQRVARQ